MKISEIMCDEFYYLLRMQYICMSEELFEENFKAIRLGYLLAKLEEEE